MLIFLAEEAEACSLGAGASEDDGLTLSRLIERTQYSREEERGERA